MKRNNYGNEDHIQFKVISKRANFNIACNPNHNSVFKNHRHEKEDQRETHPNANNAEMMGNLFLLLISQIFIMIKKNYTKSSKGIFKSTIFKILFFLILFYKIIFK